MHHPPQRFRAAAGAVGGNVESKREGETERDRERKEHREREREGKKEKEVIVDGR